MATTVTFSAGDKVFTCDLNKIDPDRIFAELDFCYEASQNRYRSSWSSILFYSEAPGELTLAGINIRSEESLIRALAYYYVMLENSAGPSNMRDLLDFMSGMRKDHAYLQESGDYGFLSDNPYKANVENRLLHAYNATNFTTTGLVIEGDNYRPKISFPDDDRTFVVSGPRVTRDLLVSLITEQNVFPLETISREAEKCVVTFQNPCNFMFFAKLLIARVNMHVDNATHRGIA